MDLTVVFHPPQLGRRIQAGKLVSPEKDPPSGGRACVSLHRKVCARAPDHPPGATYYAQIVGGSTGAPGRHRHAGANPAWFHRMPAHGGHHGDFWGGGGGLTASAPYTKKKDVSPVDWFEDVQLAHSVCNTHFLQE
jgi:hypothetical protein